MQNKWALARLKIITFKLYLDKSFISNTYVTYKGWYPIKPTNQPTNQPVSSRRFFSGRSPRVALFAISFVSLHLFWFVVFYQHPELFYVLLGWDEDWPRDHNFISTFFFTSWELFNHYNPLRPKQEVEEHYGAFNHLDRAFLTNSPIYFKLWKHFGHLIEII